MNRSSRVPLLTKEGSGEVLQRRVSNLPLAPSLVRRGFIGPTDQRHSAGPNLRASGTMFFSKQPLSPLTLSRRRLFRRRIEGCPLGREPLNSLALGFSRLRAIEPGNSFPGERGGAVVSDLSTVSAPGGVYRRDQSPEWPIQIHPLLDCHAQRIRRKRSAMQLGEVNTSTGARHVLITPVSLAGKLRRTRPRPEARGRRPGIDPRRRQALAEMARSGPTLAEMAAMLGVSRQCVQMQLAKCPDIYAERLAHRQARNQLEAARSAIEGGIQWIARASRSGTVLAQFLRAAMAHGWTVEVAPRRRPRVNGVPLSFHTPRRTRPSSRMYARSRTTRYYHIQLGHPDWLHVVYLPAGHYVFYLPDPKRRRVSHYIRARPLTSDSRWSWPTWPPQGRSTPAVAPKSPSHRTIRSGRARSSQRPLVEWPLGRGPYTVDAEGS